MKIKQFKTREREYKIIDEVTDRQKELIDIFFKRDLCHCFNITKEEDFKDHTLITIDNFKEFVFSEELVLLEDENKIYPTQILMHKYPETFGEYGENLAMYEDKEIEDISKIYYPNIKYIRLMKKDYLKDLKVIKIKDNKIIKHTNISQKYLTYIEKMLKIEKLDYEFSNFVHRNRGVYTFYNLEIDKLLLDIAANLDAVYSHYRENPWANWGTKTLGDAAKYFPTIMERLDEKGLKSAYENKFEKDTYIELGVFVKEAIKKDDFNTKTLDSYNMRKRYLIEDIDGELIAKEREAII